MRESTRIPFKPSFKSLQLFAMMGFLLSSCGLINNATPSATCSTGTAEIQVYDGMIKRICGCAEAGNVSFTSGQSLVCTIDAGTRVYFNFVGIQTNHMIVVSGVASTPTFGGSSSSVQTGVVQMNNTGTFSFQDFYYPTLGGSLIVN